MTATTHPVPLAPPEPGLHPRSGRELFADALRTVSQHWAVAAVLGVAGIVFGANLNGYPEYLNDDEGTYFAQAWAVLHGHGMAHYTYWYDHPPLGWIQLAVLMKPYEWIFGTPDVAHGVSVTVEGRAISAAYMVAAAWLMYRLGRNLWLPKYVAMLSPLIWMLSPMTLHFGRQVFLDNFTMPWVLAAFVLMTGKANLHHHVLGGLCFGIAVLSKETALLALPGMLLALWTFSWPRTRLFSFVGVVLSSALVMSCYLLFAGIKQEIFPGPGHVSLLTALTWQLGGRETNGFLFTHGSMANDLLMEWQGHDWWTLPVGMAASLIALAFRRSRPLALVPLVYLLSVLRGGYVPRMHIVVPLPFMAICLVFVIHAAWSRLVVWPHAVRAIRVTIAAVVLAAATTVAPVWAKENQAIVDNYQNDPYRSALQYVAAQLPRNSRILTDDTTWNDLVALGWSGDRWDGPIWHFKLDRDPEARQHLPNGWRDIQYVLAGRPMKALINTVNIQWSVSPQVQSAMENSHPIKTWGAPTASVSLYRVDPARTQGCDKWNCAGPEPAWTNPDGTGGSDAAQIAGRKTVAEQGWDPYAGTSKTEQLKPRAAPALGRIPANG